MIDIAKNVIFWGRKTMTTRRVELTCDAETLGEIPIKTGIFHRDALAPMLFLIVLIPLTLILRTANPGMNFELERW